MEKRKERRSEKRELRRWMKLGERFIRAILLWYANEQYDIMVQATRY